MIPREGGRITLVIGDVTGHGVRAALVASFLKALVDSAFADASRGGDAAWLGALLASLNDRICGSLPDSQGMLITLAAAEIDPVRHELILANAGHPAPLLLGAGDALPLTIVSLPLGAAPRVEFPVLTYRLEDDDLLVMYTDGMVEVEAGGEGESVERRTERLVRSVKGLRAEERIAERIVTDMLPAGGYTDDVTILTARLNPSRSR